MVVLLGQMAFAMVTTALAQAPTIDEPVYVGAAALYLQGGGLQVNPEHPPLGKLIIGAGLMFAEPRIDPGFRGNQSDLGRHVLYEAGNDADQVLSLARLPMIGQTGRRAGGCAPARPSRPATRTSLARATPSNRSRRIWLSMVGPAQTLASLADQGDVELSRDAIIGSLPTSPGPATTFRVLRTAKAFNDPPLRRNGASSVFGVSSVRLSKLWLMGHADAV
ncbi:MULTISPECIES: hypothetical protein [unclassified Solwaraspora]|uniref:hypothetical protein n=1 Tax=unclassified Solwaraspora TaxID=2627926 RepID=UPI00248C80FF|nr:MULTISPECIES: hypothetical protein [unclassified Solwaraspora]WBB94879.1 hypothetical protein O7553_15695 [Solwaraspora sp. WMMA2059]WBC21237.1 hypothetical protein O7543_01675 [Solwaraspora sp. WMMA2080]WJK36681.1 hypothetical protein O7610_10225 [Solwaraspora sp. WMMA2065]